MFLCGKTTPPLKFQKFPKLSQSVFQNLKQDMCSVAVFSRRENPPPSIFALANPSTQTKKIRFISAPLSGPVSSAFQQLRLREPQPPFKQLIITFSKELLKPLPEALEGKRWFRWLRLSKPPYNKPLIIKTPSPQ